MGRFGGSLGDGYPYLKSSIPIVEAMSKRKQKMSKIKERIFQFKR